MPKMPAAVTSTALLEADNLSVSFGNKTVLKDVSVQLHSGKVSSVIGPNGAGKSTLVKAMLGLVPLNGGQVRSKGKLRIGYMPQKLNLDPSLPIHALDFLKLASHDLSNIDKQAELCGVANKLKQPLANLSGGELQRVLLCRALLREPQLLVLDEPAQGVDVKGQAELYQLIGQLRQDTNCGVLMISHDLHFVMAGTDEVICLNQHVCCHGHPESVSAHPEYLRLFGDEGHRGLALYTHHHDHEHNIHGDITHSQCEH